jgi:hypothetical protein
MKRTTRNNPLVSSSTSIVIPFILFGLLVSGCNSAGNLMTKTKPIVQPQPGKALVTFVRPSFVGGAITFGIWDSDNFVGVLSAGQRIDCEMVPGPHYFLARAENWSCVKADLAANRHYVIKVNPFIGVWKARVAMDPVTKSNYDSGQLKDVQKWLAKLTPMTPDPQQAAAYAEPRRAQVMEARATFESGKGKYEVLGPQDYLPE